MPEITEAAGRVPLRRRRKMLRDFRKRMGVTLVKLGGEAKVSQPMLSQFEKGDRDLSADAWKRVHAAMQTLIEHDKAKHKTEVADAREIAARLGPDMYSCIERRFSTDARSEVAEELRLISVFQNSLDNDAHPKTKRWLAAEMAVVQAQLRAIEAAVEARAERHPNEPGDAMRICAATKTSEGKVVPWRDPSISSVTERISMAAKVAEAQVCLVFNPKQEAELRAAGWKEVKSE